MFCDIREFESHRFRQIPNQIKRLGAFFDSTIKSTINHDLATFRDSSLDSTGSLPASTTKRPDLWGFSRLRFTEMRTTGEGGVLASVFEHHADSAFAHFG
jgi:hypothetical protein